MPMKEVFSTIFFLFVVAGLLWGWNHWQATIQGAKDTRPSIGALATESKSSVSESKDPVAEAPVSVVEEKKPVVSSNSTAKETLDVKVLNGGAAKGSAVKVQDLLKKSGYVKAQSGSSVGNYTGTTVYYLGSNEASATAIQQLLVKDYPSASVKMATSSSAENGSASIVVMLGK